MKRFTTIARDADGIGFYRVDDNQPLPVEKIVRELGARSAEIENGQGVREVVAGFEDIYEVGPGTVVSQPPPAPARHLLVLVSELGPDGGCTDTNPYRGSIGEIQLT